VTAIRIVRAGPLTSLQDAGRFGYLRHGVSASGPMDRAAYNRAAAWLGGAGSTALEFTTAGIALVVEGGSLAAACDGGSFTLRHNGEGKDWPARLTLKEGDLVEIAPGPEGNYGYLRFDREIEMRPVLGSRATNVVAGVGGLEGRTLRRGDRLELGARAARAMSLHPRAVAPGNGPIRFLWGLHAEMFSEEVRQTFVAGGFFISQRIDRMGARLEDRSGVFTGSQILSLVSDAVVPGDIQILGDGTPIVLMRDHQPTGGYPRIGTVIDVDLDRLAQLRPGSPVMFEPVTMGEAQQLLRERRS
jgi:biotin-dependent carboxylase-like uncharacterized protein